MNINYEDIITKAIARKEQLKAVTAKLEGLDERSRKPWRSRDTRETPWKPFLCC